MGKKLKKQPDTKDVVKVPPPNKAMEKFRSADDDELRRIVDDINHAQGGNVIALGSDLVFARSIKRIPTGAFALDYAMGGGLPMGRSSFIYGQPGSGKSSIAKMAAGQAQKMCRRCLKRIHVKVRQQDYIDLKTGEVQSPTNIFEDWSPLSYLYEPSYRKAADLVAKRQGAVIKVDYKYSCECTSGKPSPAIVAWVDTENDFEMDWAANFGIVHEGRFLFIRGKEGEEVIDIGEALLRYRAVDLMVVDSIAMMVPKKEREAASTDERPALQAKLMNRCLRKWCLAVCGAGVEPKGFAPTLIFINQTRLNVGAMYGDPTVRPGGQGQLFAGAVDIKVSKGKHDSSVLKKYRGKPFAKDGKGRVISQAVKFSIPKCKIAPPQGEGVFTICLRPHNKRALGSVNDEIVTIDFAKQMNLFPQNGPFEFEGEQFEDFAAFAERLQDHEFFLRVRDYVMESLLQVDPIWMTGGKGKHAPELLEDPPA